MNETIGVKGGRKDRQITLKITKKNKIELEKYYKEMTQEQQKKLEKKVAQQQVLTFLKILPLVTFGTIYTTITEKLKEEKEIVNLQKIKEHIIKSDLFEEKRTKEIITVIDLKINQLEQILKNKELQEVLNQTDKLYFQVSDSEVLILDLLNQDNLKTGLLSELTNQEKDLVITKEELNYLTTLEKDELENIKVKNTESTLLETISNKLSGSKEKNKSLKVEVQEILQNEIPMKKAQPEEINEKIERLKNHRIIEEYDNKLKDVRLELRNLIFEYNTIDAAINNTYNSKEAEVLLDRLNIIIKKIDELKKKIELPDIDKYDNDYLYVLIEEYIEEFKNKKFVDEIKDSNLYILISEKLTELDNKKNLLSEKIESKKEKLEIDEERLRKLKNKYFDYERFNTELLKFQNEQDMILKEINEKLSKATTASEKVEIKIKGMERQNKRLLALLTAQMMVPGARSAKGLITATAISLYFMKNLMNPKTTAKKYATIKIEDYQSEIEANISKIEDISVLLNKTINQIDIIISDIKRDFSDYIYTIPECMKLITDLENIKESIKEKEYELEKIKEEQQLNLEKNNKKVKSLENN